jgi:allantoate deiminase
MDLDTLTAEVLARCDALARFSEAPGWLTRTFLRPPVRQVHECLTNWMRAAGLRVRVDAVGNLIGRRPATHPDSLVFAVGSHIDTVPDAGKYDGILGVLLAIAAAQALPDRRRHIALDVIAFSEEEGVRFGTPYLGSRAVCGRFDPALLERTDADGVALAQAVRDYGLDPAAIPVAAYPAGQVAGYLEAHIEQGPVLESLDLSLGVVEAIVGQSRYWLTVTGRAGHAGTQPMEHRRDALAAAAAFVGAVERTARATPGLRATVGSLTVAPGAVNVVPGEVRLSLDVRHAEDGVRTAAVADLLGQARAITAGRRVGLVVEPVTDQVAVPCDGELTGRLAAAVEAAGHPLHRLVSGAGHDAVVMASLCPVAMLFLRSPGGVSHHPDERVRPEDVRAALDVMVRFLAAELDRDG